MSHTCRYERIIFSSYERASSLLRPCLAFSTDKTSFSQTYGYNSSLHSQREHPSCHMKPSTLEMHVLCSRHIIIFADAELLSMFLAVSLSQLHVLSGSQHIGDVIFVLCNKDLKPKLITRQVQDLNSC